MTLGELKKILDATGYPVAYSHFTATPTNPVPVPPYICFLVDGSANLMADNKVYHKINNLSIELYTNKKDLIAEANLEKILDNYELPYESYEVLLKLKTYFKKIMKRG